MNKMLKNIVFLSLGLFFSSTVFGMHFLELGYNLKSDDKRRAIRNEYDPQPPMPKDPVDIAVLRHWRIWTERNDDKARAYRKERAIGALFEKK